MSKYSKKKLAVKGLNIVTFTLIQKNNNKNKKKITFLDEAGRCTVDREDVISRIFSFSSPIDNFKSGKVRCANELL